MEQIKVTYKDIKQETNNIDMEHSDKPRKTAKKTQGKVLANIYPGLTNRFSRPSKVNPSTSWRWKIRMQRQFKQNPVRPRISLKTSSKA
eukprot:824871-Pelagomonas_calceolata.AAC.4